MYFKSILTNNWNKFTNKVKSLKWLFINRKLHFVTQKGVAFYFYQIKSDQFLLVASFFLIYIGKLIRVNFYFSFHAILSNHLNWFIFTQNTHFNWLLPNCWDYYDAAGVFRCHIMSSLYHTQLWEILLAFKVEWHPHPRLIE